MSFLALRSEEFAGAAATLPSSATMKLGPITLPSVSVPKKLVPTKPTSLVVGGGARVRPTSVPATPDDPDDQPTIFTTFMVFYCAHLPSRNSPLMALA